ncbi:hypothetical protein [Zhongshania sp.]|jgi:hypothetical protein|uniref:hypothetical protein n=1 Tax=Zhongshania sp. TaxID=1971902 RepID=UPI0039E59DE7
MRINVVNMPETALKIGRFTTEFRPVEDRLCLIGEPRDKARSTTAIWLTQRLLKQLIPELIKAVDAPQYRGSEHANALHSFAQSAAQDAVHPPETPIARPNSNAYVLPETVNISHHGNALELRFVDHQHNLIALPLPSVMIRQWLCVLLRCYQIALWPTTPFPPWVDPADASTRAKPSLAIH